MAKTIYQQNPLFSKYQPVSPFSLLPERPWHEATCPFGPSSPFPLGKKVHISHTA